LGFGALWETNARKQERVAAMSLDHKAVSQRLTHLREEMGYMYVTPFAKYLGVKIGRLWYAENGGPLAKELALIIVERCPSVTLDWLYLGRTKGLSVSMSRRLGAQ
jgi:hypothetical protein